MKRSVTVVVLLCVWSMWSDVWGDAASRPTTKPANKVMRWAKGQVHLTQQQAERFARLSLHCAVREYPNKLGQVLQGDQALLPPRKLRPAFYGCFDWHSAVHGHWALVRLLKKYPKMRVAGKVRKLLGRHLTKPRLAREAAFFRQRVHRTFERPYGWGWFLRLVGELHTWKDADARRWRKALVVLETLLVKRLFGYLKRLSAPVRSGVHANTAFALVHVYDYADAVGNKALLAALKKAARRFYGKDRMCPTHYEPSGEDFISPCLAEADLMRRVLSRRAFGRWFRRFLPPVRSAKFRSVRRPPRILDRKDYKIGHLIGLCLQRAWAMQGLVAWLKADAPRRAVLQRAMVAHRAFALQQMFDSGYGGTHWLASFAVYLLTGVGLPAKPRRAAPTSQPVVHLKLRARGAKKLAAVTSRLKKMIRKTFVKRRLPGLSVGIVDDQALVFSAHMGVTDRKAKKPPTDRTLYRIGSITKVFTTSLLAKLRDDGKLRLDDPVQTFLPASVKMPTDPRGAKQITLRHLATHTSGLPRLPHNTTPTKQDFYNAYTRTQLFDGLSSTVLDSPIGAQYRYSNLGLALLGVALSEHTKTPYETLIQKHLLMPLKMHDSGFRLTPARRKLLAAGYKFHPLFGATPAKPWRVGILSPAGGLLSSVQDLAKWLALQHRAGTVHKGPISGGSLTELHRVQRILAVRKGRLRGGIGLGWHVFSVKKAAARAIWHNGGVAGFRSFIAFSPEIKMGVIVLTNSSRSADKLGFSILRLLVKTQSRKRQKPPSPRLLRVAKSLCAQFVTTPKDDTLKLLFSPYFRLHVPLPQLRQIFASAHKQHGRCLRSSWRKVRNARVGQATFHFAKGGHKVHMLLGIDGSKAGRLLLMRILPK